MLDINTIRSHFPILKREINGKALVYFDNAATSQKPQSVIDAISDFYENTNANIHRGVHTLSEQATEAYEGSRERCREFINARNSEELIFTRNTTESINLVAYTWGEQNISAGDEIIVSELEHHSNLVPWQELCKRKGAKLQIVPIKEDFTLDYEAYKNLLSPKTKLVAISGMSNALGTVQDLDTIISQAKNIGAKVLVDAAQLVCHFKVDVQALDCDFLAFSAHKMLGPTGVGVLYVKKEILDEMPPFLFGGDMVKSVTADSANWNSNPWKFEAGTPNIADVCAFKQAMNFLDEIGFEQIHAHDQQLLKRAQEILATFPQIKSYCPAESCSILSFTIDGIHPHDIAEIFNSQGIALRAGHHCAHPLMTKLGVSSTARLSFYLYNSLEEVEKIHPALEKCLKIFG